MPVWMAKQSRLLATTRAVYASLLCCAARKPQDGANCAQDRAYRLVPKRQPSARWNQIYSSINHFALARDAQCPVDVGAKMHCGRSERRQTPKSQRSTPVRTTLIDYRRRI